MACPAGGPISWEEMGERTPEGRGSSLWTPFSGGIGWGEAVPLMGYPACGPHIGRSVTARPPAGRAGGRGWVPFGKRQRVTVRVPVFPSVNKPLLPPARAGGRAMRRWSWRPQARPLPDGTTFPRSPHQRMGFQGEGTSFPWCSFPYFSKEIGPRPGGPRSRPFQRRRENPTSSPPGQAAIQTAPGPAVPRRGAPKNGKRHRRIRI